MRRPIRRHLRPRARAARLTFTSRTTLNDGATIHLHDEGPREGASSRPPGPQGYLAVVLSRREDRRARPERRWEELATEDHGRRRHALRRRGLPGRRHQDRLSPTGAAAEPGARRPRQRGAGSSRGARRSSSATTRSTRSSPRSSRPTRWTRSSPSRAACRTGSTRSARGSSTRRSRWRWTPCGCPPGDAAVATLSGGERRRVALCRLLAERSGPAAARRADEPPRRRVGRLARTLPPRLPGHGRRRHPRPVLPRQRRRAGFSSSIAGPASRGRATTRRGSIRSSSGSRWKRRRSRSVSAPCSASSSGFACRPARGRRRARRASPPTNSCWPRTRRRRPTARRSTSPPARGSATWSSKRASCGRATATCC